MKLCTSVYSFLYLSPLFQTAGRLKQQVPGSQPLSSQEAVELQEDRDKTGSCDVLLDFGPDVHSLGLDPGCS